MRELIAQASSLALPSAKRYPPETAPHAWIGSGSTPLDCPARGKLPHADLRGAIFTGANLREADLRGAKLGKRQFGEEEEEHAGQLIVSAGQNVETPTSEARSPPLTAPARYQPPRARPAATPNTAATRRQPRPALIGRLQLRYLPRTRAYAKRRAAEGKTKAEILRCLSATSPDSLPHAERDLAPSANNNGRTATTIYCGAGPSVSPHPALKSRGKQPDEPREIGCKGGLENGYRPRSGWASRGDVVALSRADIYFRGPGPASPKWLYAIASRDARVGHGREHRDGGGKRRSRAISAMRAGAVA